MQDQVGSQSEVSAGAGSLLALVDPVAKCQATLYLGQEIPWNQDK